ncbi:hypothetical protein FXN61_00960 [Lentzea sp. PSKA42]|uniref:Amino acid permease n=1 Tax=Lentzea indica TaxID=2604800 RepID=A0ABX1F979_9PSEU|nr:hypothetical protein [Lentzea indica]NKE55465.1 hypothetical protein [Lentzea indica]
MQIGFATLVAAIYAVAGLDPLTDLTASMTGIGTLGVITLQAMAGIAVVAYFRRRRDPRIWRTAVAPGVGGLGLISVTVLAVANFPTLAGSEAPAVTLLPWLLAVAVAVGLGISLVLKIRRPEVYAALDRFGVGESIDAR